ncbi:MAG: mitochondrial fission ELM1 family protein [Alphaproteobacteria bacterium]|nr:mitochondrial fission ELM1 family protein [Alphaproteobacteria bacterium]
MAAALEPPRIWILWRRRKGDLDQMLALVTALGWPHVIKRLDFAPPDIPILAPLLLKGSSDDISPPWPDAVICAEALPSMIARRLRKQSGGRIRSIALARPAGSPDAFDLVITTAQYRLPAAANILELGMPLGDPSSLVVPEPESNSPRVAVAVGGSSFPDRLDADAAREMALALMSYGNRHGMTLDIITSPRTGSDAAQALKSAIAAPHVFHEFKPGAENPYRRLLAAASEIVVTSDSVSMVADALATGKPVSVYRLPQSRNLKWRITEWLYANAVLRRNAWFSPVRWAFDAGMFEAAADRHLLFDRLSRDGRLSWFGEPLATPRPGVASADMALAVGRVKALMGIGPEV